jgi:16S rRNA (cytosine967-C5)-methyltransferase
MLIAQTVAAHVIARVLAGRTLDYALGSTWARTPDIEPRDKALTQELCYGTLRHLGGLRATVRKLLIRPAADARLEALLWVALYQLRHSAAPAHAIVDNAVDAATRLQVTSAKGLVNAVLRFYLRNRATIDAEAPATDEARYSHPQWWIDLVRKEYPTTWPQILQASNARPPLTLRVNRRKAVRDSELRDFAAAGFPCRPIGTDGLVVEDPRNVVALPGFSGGRLSVQDAGAQLAAPFLEVEDGMRVLDACAAPGGKTTHVLERVRCELIALDRDNRRLGKIWENLARLGLSATTRQADAANLSSWWDEKQFDRVLLDAPCTASGVMRRHPDGKWLRRAGDIAQFAQQQHRLLDALWPTLRPGGRLLYTTCSIFSEENEVRVRDFLSRHPDAWRRELPWPDGVRRHGDGQLLPADGAGEDNHDGFFYALVEKRGG